MTTPMPPSDGITRSGWVDPDWEPPYDPYLDDEDDDDDD